MTKKILFGTTNQGKIAYVKRILKSLPLEVISISDMNINIDVEEDGKTTGENALKKSLEYYAKSKIPTFSFDSGLYIDKFDDDKQPGLFVRRINGKKASDEEMLQYYIMELDKVGGESKAKWITSVAFVLSEDQILTQDFIVHRLFTSKRSKIMTQGNPLNSIQIDLAFGKYVSEITAEDRSKIKGELDANIFDFFKEYIKKL